MRTRTLVAALALAFAAPAAAQDIMVDPTATPDPYTFNTLAEGLQAASLGANVLVAAGDYTAEIVPAIGRTTQIIGLDRDNVLLPRLDTTVGVFGNPTVTLEAVTLFCPIPGALLPGTRKAPNVNLSTDNVISNCGDTTERVVIMAEGSGLLEVFNSEFYGSGTHLLVDGTSLSVANTVFSGLQTPSRAVLYQDGSGLAMPTLSIDGSTFSAFERAGGNGGGVYVNAPTASVSITDTSFLDNVAASGGGVYIRDSASVSIADSTFSGNDNEALVLVDSEGTVMDTTFDGNVSGVNSIGTGAATVTLTRNHFTGQTNAGVLSEQVGGLTIHGSDFCGNDTDLLWSGGTVTVEGSVFALGTGVNAIQGTSSVTDLLTVRNTTFAGYDDAAIWIPAAAGYTTDITETIFHDLGATAVYGDGTPGVATSALNNLFASAGWASGVYLDADVSSGGTTLDPDFQGYIDRTTSTCDNANLWLDINSPLRDIGTGADLDGSASDAGGFGGPFANLVDADGDNAYEDIDCDETDPTINPSAADIAHDGIDQDCDGLDNLDADGDGFDADFAGGDDCDDNDATVNPGALEIPWDGIDQDCDGYDILDVDGDGFDGGVAGTDCDDMDPAINPDATEVFYDGVDQNCDGLSDFDQDGDGYDSNSYQGTDCDDLDDQVHPGSTDLPDNGIDEDCDGADATAGTGTGTGTGTATGTGTGGDPPKEDKGCNSTGTVPSGWALLTGLGLLGLRRRR